MYSNSFFKKNFEPQYLILKEALGYKNKDLSDRFCREYGADRKIANLLLKDLIRYLWLVYFSSVLAKSSLIKNKNKFLVVPIFESMLPLDEMWHSFLLYSIDYEEFCRKHFNVVIPHIPDLPGMAQASPKHGPKKNALKSSDDRLLDSIDFVWHTLGSKVANRWFKEYKDNFTVRISKKISMKK